MLFFFCFVFGRRRNLLFCSRSQAVSGAAPPIKISLFGLFQARDTKEVIAPQKDNTLRTTHTQYVCRPVVVHLRAQQFVVPIKNAKDHQFEESSKMPPFSGTFCFVLFCVYIALVVVLSSCPPLPSEREKRKQIFSPVDQDVFVLLLVTLY